MSRPLPVIAAALVLGALGFGLWRSFQPVPLPLQGQVEAQEVNVSAKIAGRVGQVLVQPGQMVEAGAPLFQLDSPEVAAKLAQAQGAQAAAQAVSLKASNGARPQEVEMARLQWQRAVTAADLATATLQRVQSLFDEGLVARQKRDEAEAQSRAADQQAQAAQAQYELARQGARAEDKAAAAGQVRQVGGVVAEVEAARDETLIKAPVAAEVARVQIQPGELAPAGFPVVTLVQVARPWVVLQLREDELAAFPMGSEHEAELPALHTRVRLKVSAIAVLPDFATWRAAKQGGADLRTFELRLQPVGAVQGWRPGMSVRLARP